MAQEKVYICGAIRKQLVPQLNEAIEQMFGYINQTNSPVTANRNRVPLKLDIHGQSTKSLRQTCQKLGLHFIIDSPIPGHGIFRTIWLPGRLSLTRYVNMFGTGYVSLPELSTMSPGEIEILKTWNEGHFVPLKIVTGGAHV